MTIFATVAELLVGIRRVCSNVSQVRSAQTAGGTSFIVTVVTTEAGRCRVPFDCGQRVAAFTVTVTVEIGTIGSGIGVSVSTTVQSIPVNILVVIDMLELVIDRSAVSGSHHMTLRAVEVVFAVFDVLGVSD